MSNPSISEILRAYAEGHIVERRWRTGSTDQCRIDGGGQAWQDDEGSGAWRRANFIYVQAPENGTIRIIRQRTEQDVRDNPIPGDKIRCDQNGWRVVVAVTQFNLFVESDSGLGGIIPRDGYWHDSFTQRDAIPAQPEDGESITPAQPEQP